MPLLLGREVLEAADRARLPRRLRHVRRRARVARRGDGEHGRTGRAGRPLAAHVQDPAPAGRRARLRLGARREVRPLATSSCGGGSSDEGLPHAPRPGLRPRDAAAAECRGPRAGPRAGHAAGRDGAGRRLPARGRRAGAARTGSSDPEAIRYRQRILARLPRAAGAAAGAVRARRRGRARRKQKGRFFWFRDSPDGILHKSLADARPARRRSSSGCGRSPRSTRRSSESDGFGRLFASFARSSTTSTSRTVDDHLQELSFQRGALISARARPRQQGHRLRPAQAARAELARAADARPGRAATASPSPPATSTAPARSASCAAKGINKAANALAQSTDHVLSFFTMLRAELGFYVGCLNLTSSCASGASRPACPIRAPLDGRGVRRARPLRRRARLPPRAPASSATTSTPTGSGCS